MGTRHTITTEEEFITLMKLGIPIRAGDSRMGMDDGYCDGTCVPALEGSDGGYGGWADSFRRSWLPGGTYWVEVE